MSAPAAASSAASAVPALPVPIVYKDFEKESRDILSKNTSAGGKWKVEHKSKAAKNSFAVNPICGNDGKVSVEVEGVVPGYGVNYKLFFTPEDLDGIKTTIGYNYLGQKLEVTLARKKDNNHDIEIAQSGLSLLGPVGMVYLSNKLLSNGQKLESSASACVSGMQVGCDAVIDLKNQKLNRWSAAVMTRMMGRHVVVRTNQLEEYTVCGSTPLPLHPMFSPRLVTCLGYNPKQEKLSTECGLEVPCPLLPGNTLKARMDKQKEWTFTYVAQLPNRWSLGLSFDKSKKTGVVLSQS